MFGTLFALRFCGGSAKHQRIADQFGLCGRPSATGADKGQLLLDTAAQSAAFRRRAAVFQFIDQAVGAADLFTQLCDHPAVMTFIKSAHNDSFR